MLGFSGRRLRPHARPTLADVDTRSSGPLHLVDPLVGGGPAAVSSLQRLSLASRRVVPAHAWTPDSHSRPFARPDLGQEVAGSNAVTPTILNCTPPVRH